MINTMKEKLFVSFSGGKTSAYMSYMLKKDYGHKYDMRFVFANTGLENEQTLKFVDQCDRAFGLDVVWIEAVINPEHMKGVTHKIVNFETAARNGEPFEAFISKSGIPNANKPQCSDRLKALPIEHYKKTIGWKGCKHAIGMRVDEPNRVLSITKRKKLYQLGIPSFNWLDAGKSQRTKMINEAHDNVIGGSWNTGVLIENSDDFSKEYGMLLNNYYNLVYPLHSWFEADKLDVNIFWEMQDFTLGLQEHQGNCATCWKKSDKKLWLISLESPEKFDFMKRMENTYQCVKPNGNGQKRVFFRKNRSVDDLFKESELMDEYTLRRMIGYKDDQDSGCSESCEAYAE